MQVFLRCLRDPHRVPRISNWVSRIRENCNWVPKIRENRVPRIREIGSLQIHTRFLTFSLKKTVWCVLLLEKADCKILWKSTFWAGACLSGKMPWIFWPPTLTSTITGDQALNIFTVNEVEQHTLHPCWKSPL